MNSFQIIAFAVFNLVVAGCVPSTHPFYSEEDIVFDHRLLGNWGDEEKCRFVVTSQDSVCYSVFIVEDSTLEECTAHLVKLGNSHYLDILFESEYYPTWHTILKVKLEEQSLQLAELNAEWLESQMYSGVIKLWHKITPDGLMLTAPTDKLREFILQNQENEKTFFWGITLNRID